MERSGSPSVEWLYEEPSRGANHLMHLPTNPPVATVSPSRISRTASDAATILPLSRDNAEKILFVPIEPSLRACAASSFS